MKRHLLAATVLLSLAVLTAPAALAAEGDEPVATEAAPTATPEATVAPDPTPTPWDGNGEIVIDPTFLTASATPAGQVKGATGKPTTTPPPTDTAGTAATPGSGLGALLVLLAGVSSLAVVARRVPESQRRR